ncbi:MAG: rod shape-determining protein RodA [Acidimicrobiia bacterium]|nr:rod shape-determining protein RodA [Acidimicrobiia bacterium]
MATVAAPRYKPIGKLHHDHSAAWRHLDLVLIAVVGAICALGLLMIYSATRGVVKPYDTSFVTKQFMFVVLGAFAGTAVALVDYRKIRDIAPFIYGASIMLLLLVRSPLGSRQNGTQGWFQLGPFQLQPSELAKLGLIVGFAWVASQFRGEIDARRFVVLLALCALPMGLVLLQPDLGTTLVSAAVALVLLVLAGARPKQLILLALLAVIAIVAVLHSGLLGSIQEDRLTSFVNQDSAPKIDLSTASSAEYNLRQSKIAIGSGGWTGKGVFNGTQTRLNNVPFQHTDFIFTAVGEQLGLVGAASLLVAFSIMVWRILRTAQLARDDFGMLLCAGVLAMFVFQIFENVGMTMGIMPITGIPLPFMSYGGSSTITYLVSIGLVLNVHMRRFA